jgi:hypothetical protein
LTSEKMVVLAPIPTASVTTTAKAKLGRRAKVRAA